MSWQCKIIIIAPVVAAIAAIDLPGTGRFILVVMKRILAFTLLVLLSVAPFASGHAVIHDGASLHQNVAESAHHADADCTDGGCDGHDSLMCCAALAAFCNTLAITEDEDSLAFRLGSHTKLSCPDVTLHGLKPEAETPPPRV